ncbi:MAG: HNH endonuclease [Devosiaceae bacterium]|nr:HNH endonuclease [Devosiaceae bacterium]
MVQKVLDVIPDQELPEHYYAILEPSTMWSFERVVPRANYGGHAFESSLRGPEGAPMSGGANVSAVRRLTTQEFAAIFAYGMHALQGPDTLPRNGEEIHETIGFLEQQIPFEPAPLSQVRDEVLVSRKLRDASFARQVKAAYSGRCAISGLSLRNGGGRPEVQAAHIRPVKNDGPDIISNGLALSGTLHWMFDRGLISVAEDYRILVSHNKVPAVTANRLITQGQKLILPEKEKHYPHPDYLRYHREEIFGQAA